MSGGPQDSVIVIDTSSLMVTHEVVQAFWDATV